jgi:hypothetical protein
MVVSPAVTVKLAGGAGTLLCPLKQAENQSTQPKLSFFFNTMPRS